MTGRATSIATACTYLANERLHRNDGLIRPECRSDLRCGFVQLWMTGERPATGPVLLAVVAVPDAAVLEPELGGGFGAVKEAHARTRLPLLRLR